MITYTPPKVISRAPNVVEPKGKGTVVIQVLVNANGTFKVMRVMSSTNPGDNAAAMDIAKHSKYAPAIRNGKPVPDFFDFSIAFGENVVSGAAGQIDALLHQSKWDEAKAAATAALAQNPSDSLVQAQLGVADAFTHDIGGSVQAFDKAGSIPSQYANVAAQAYSLQAQSELAKDPKAALALAQKAVALNDDYGAYYALGASQLANGDDNSAEASLQKAKALALDAKPPASGNDLVSIDETLMQIATAHGDTAAATRLAGDIKALNPNLSQKIIAYSYDTQGEASKKRGDLNGAIKLFEQAAASDPSWAGPLEYTKAAIAYTSLPVPNYLGAKDAADKAISDNPSYALAYYVEGVALAKNALATGNANQGQDADIYLRKAVDLAKAQHNDSLAQAAQYFEADHSVNANLQFWSTQISARPSASGMPIQQGPSVPTHP